MVGFRAIPFDPDKPYSILLLLSPHPQLEINAMLKTGIVTNKMLAELKGAGELILNQGE